MLKSLNPFKMFAKADKPPKAVKVSASEGLRNTLSRLQNSDDYLKNQVSELNGEKVTGVITQPLRSSDGTVNYNISIMLNRGKALIQSSDRFMPINGQSLINAQPIQVMPAAKDISGAGDTLKRKPDGTPYWGGMVSISKRRVLNGVGEDFLGTVVPQWVKMQFGRRSGRYIELIYNEDEVAGQFYSGRRDNEYLTGQLYQDRGAGGFKKSLWVSYATGQATFWNKDGSAILRINYSGAGSDATKSDWIVVEENLV